MKKLKICADKKKRARLLSATVLVHSRVKTNPPAVPTSDRLARHRQPCHLLALVNDHHHHYFSPSLPSRVHAGLQKDHVPQLDPDEEIGVILCVLLILSRTNSNSDIAREEMA